MDSGAVVLHEPALLNMVMTPMEELVLADQVSTDPFRNVEDSLETQDALGSQMVPPAEEFGDQGGAHEEIDGIGNGEYEEFPYDQADHYGYEEAAPRQRRGSIVDRIMTWAGMVNHEQFYAANEGNSHSVIVSRNAFEGSMNRRSSLDMGGNGRPLPINVSKRRCHSSDDMDLDPSEPGEENVLNVKIDKGRAMRRNSLQAMVEKAMAYVNLMPEPNDDDLCPFGTRRDSLF